MQEHEPHFPNYSELRKIHEAPAPPQLPSHQPNRPNYAELKAAQQPEPTRERDEEKSQPAPEPLNLADEAEAKMAAYRKALQSLYEAGRIDKHEMIRREKQYDQQLVSAIQSAPEGKAVVLPDPQPARTSQQLQDEGNQRQGPQQLVIKPMDWERMQENPAYRKQMEEQTKALRAFQLQQVQKDKDGGPQHPGSGGRER